MSARFIPPLFGNGLDGGALWNAVMTLRGRELGLGPAGASMHFDVADVPSPDDWCLAVAIRKQAIPLIVAIKDFPFREAFDVDLAVGDIAGLPDGVREALQDGLHAVIRSMLPAELNKDLVVADTGRIARFTERSGEPLEWLSLRITQPSGLFVDLLAGWPRRLIADEAQRSVKAGADLGGQIAESLTVPADMTLGAITVTLRELAALECGAVVVLSESEADSLKVRIGEMLFTFTNIGEGWRCSGPQSLNRHRPRAALHRPVGANMENGSENGVPAEAEDAPMALTDLTIAIDFDLGRSMVPLGTVAGWQAGSVIDLALPSIGDGVEVTIRANGDVVGHGDLVRIDERIAVRITRFMLRS